MSVTDPTEAARPTAGVDWATTDHAVAIVDPDGEQTHRFSITHDAAGLRTLVKRLLLAGVAEVGIERPDGPVVDALRHAGLVVFVIPPGQLKNLRSRYGSAGNKDDRFDAYVLADVVRTDHHRLRPLLVDTPATTTLRQTVRARRDLVAHRVAHRVAVANQLRAHLQTYFPGVVGLLTSTPRSPCGSWNASTPKTALTGSRSNVWLPGWRRLATAAGLIPSSCTPA
jgi:transposase